MRTKAHVPVASVTTHQRLTQESDTKWSRKLVAALLTAFLMVAFVPMEAFAQHTVGSLYFVNGTNGAEAFGYLDRDGYFRQTQGHYYTAGAKIGVTHVVNTTDGLLLYKAYGQRNVVQIRDDGYADDFPAGF